MAEVGMGSLYDMNRTIMQQQSPLSEQEIEEALNEVDKYFYSNKQYFMLLCHERRDYTLFDLGYETYYDYKEKCKKTVDVLIDECLKNRGEIRGIDITKDKQAIEI